MAGIYPWQKRLLMDIESGGFNAGELTIMMAGRQTGKSHFNAQALKRLMEDMLVNPLEELTLSEGTVYGSRYYCVQPIGGNWWEMEKWCKATMGDAGKSIWGHDPKKAPLPNERWYMNNRKFWFREEKDRTMFIMKWR